MTELDVAQKRDQLDSHLYNRDGRALVIPYSCRDVFLLLSLVSTPFFPISFATTLVQVLNYSMPEQLL